MKLKTGLLVTLICILLSSLLHAQTIHMVTEHYPPFNIRSTDPKDIQQITGISVDIVKKLFRRAGISYTIKLYPWKRAFRMAVEKKNHAVFSTTRTQMREKKFKWVGPIAENHWVFFAKPGTTIRINHLEEARPYRIGGYKGDAIAEFLLKNRFQPSMPVSDHLNARKLAKGKIDLWATGKIHGAYIARQEGVETFEPIYEIKKVYVFIAFNIETPADTINLLNQVLKEMHQEGITAGIYRKYLDD